MSSSLLYVQNRIPQRKKKKCRSPPLHRKPKVPESHISKKTALFDCGFRFVLLETWSVNYVALAVLELAR